MQTDRKNHWENVYETKNPEQVSWTQEIPKTSLEFIDSFNLPKDASIIDIGGGDSKLVDFLLKEGFTNLTVLDISSKALERAKKRLGKNAKKINWIVSDIIEFQPDQNYDVWHDRAAFHFLTDENQIKKYIEIASKHVTKYLILGTFSANGPKKCSGLEISQYSEDKISKLWNVDFEKIKCLSEDHTTPFDTTQNFLFCGFKKRN